MLRKFLVAAALMTSGTQAGYEPSHVRFAKDTQQSREENERELQATKESLDRIAMLRQRYLVALFRKRNVVLPANEAAMVRAFHGPSALGHAFTEQELSEHVQVLEERRDRLRRKMAEAGLEASFYEFHARPLSHRLPEECPQQRPIECAMSSYSSKQLIELFADDDFHVRDSAMRMVIDRHRAHRNKQTNKASPEVRLLLQERNNADLEVQKRVEYALRVIRRESVFRALERTGDDMRRAIMNYSESAVDSIRHLGGSTDGRMVP